VTAARCGGDSPSYTTTSAVTAPAPGARRSRARGPRSGTVVAFPPRVRIELIVTVGASMGAFVACAVAGLGGQVRPVVAVSSPVFRTIPADAAARVLGPHGAQRALAGGCSATRQGLESASLPPRRGRHRSNLRRLSRPTPVAIVHVGR